MRRITIVLLLLVLCCPALADEDYRTLQSDTTWAGTVRLDDALLVPKGVTLTIQPGTVVKVKHSWDTQLVIQGRLNAAGTKDKPIRFVVSKPGAYWSGIYVDGKTAKADVRHCHFTNARKGAVLVRRAQALFEHNRIDVKHYGGPAFICLDGGDALVHDNTIIGKSDAAVLLINASSSVRGNTIQGFAVGVQVSDRTLRHTLEPFGEHKDQESEATDPNLKCRVRDNIVADGVELFDEREVSSKAWKNVFTSQIIEAPAGVRGFDRKASKDGRTVFLIHSGRSSHKTMQKITLTAGNGQIDLKSEEAKLDRTFDQIRSKSPARSGKADLLATSTRTVLGQLRQDGCMDTQPSYALIAKLQQKANTLVWASPKIDHGKLTLHWVNMLGDKTPELIIAGSWWCKQESILHVYQQQP